jgi:choloylglycine hydrolase
MCTAIRFVDGEGTMYFGRNLDWSCSYGERVVITPTGYAPLSPFGAIERIAHATIGMGIVEEGVPLYFDCANDAGLAVAGLNFPGYAHYAPGPVEGKTNVAAYEFPLWVAANFESVDEVERALANTAIVDKPINEKFPSSLLHWIIGDAERSIVVEYTAAGMQVFHDDVDVLTNQPGFAWHAENVRNYLNVTPDVPGPVSWRTAELTAYGSGGGMRGLPGDYYSPSRFVRVAYLNAHYPQKDTERENVSRLFHTLTGVAMIDGGARMTNGEFELTIFTGGFSARTNTYYYSTYEDPAIRAVALSDYDTTGTEVIQAA